ncbi:3-isopropylmalate dehydrogenase [Staphylococcus felis]|uniref:3-isopropylmalate dehydrogenase n=1 Tax=Staphylococcus felis TaxID=46127 RepID=UPI003966E90F
MTYHIVALPGDGIGPEIMEGTLNILRLLSEKFDFLVDITSYPFGGHAIDTFGNPLPDETLKACQRADAILLGAVGGPKWHDNNCRPEQGLLQLRQALQLYANIRPTVVTPSTVDFSPIKPEVIQNTDFIIVRELTGGLYFSTPKYVKKDEALDSLHYTKEEIMHIAHIGFQLAQSRRKKLTSVDKENVLASSQLWRKTINEIAQDYPDVEVEHLLVDACTMHLIKRPTDFDVIVTENLFGDILSDEASVLPGTLGLSPSASLSLNGPHLYEPIHGSAPDIAGQNNANPFAMILSLVMCLRESLQQYKAAELIEKLTYRLIDEHYVTPDLNGSYHTTDIFEKMYQYIKEAS